MIIQGNGLFCEDEDECLLEKFDCHANATCHNTDGSYHCNCPSSMVGDGKTCEESKACETNDCHAQANCVPKSATTFTCECKEGYWGNGYSCTDKNECMKREVHRYSELI